MDCAATRPSIDRRWERPNCPTVPVPGRSRCGSPSIRSPIAATAPHAHATCPSLCSTVLPETTLPTQSVPGRCARHRRSAADAFLAPCVHSWYTPPPPRQTAAPGSLERCLPDTGLWCPAQSPCSHNAGSRQATAQRSAHPPSAVPDAWPADRIAPLIYAPLFWDSVSDCRGRTELCCASFCALPLPAVSAFVRSLARDARSLPSTGPNVAAGMLLPAPTVRRDRPHHPHSSSLECHGLPHLFSPLARMPVFTALPNGKHWHGKFCKAHGTVKKRLEYVFVFWVHRIVLSRRTGTGAPVAVGANLNIHWPFWLA